jgi:NO-binding membrane sensor protein with MHYT domain
MTHLQNNYDPILVIFSFLIAIVASSSALTCLNRMRTDPAHRALWQLGGAVSFGSGVWTMHFVGMAALRLPVLVAYNLPITALSIVFIFIGAWVAFGIVGVQQAGIVRILLGGTLLGVGVGAMHYTGMFSLRSGAELSFSLPLVGLSALVAVALSSIGLWLLNNNFGANLPFRNLLVTVVVGLAVPLMHYTGMLAARFDVAQNVGNSLSSIKDGVLSLDLILLFALIIVVGPLLANAVIPSEQAEDWQPQLEA